MNTLIGPSFNLVTNVGKDILFKATYSTASGILSLCRYMIDSDKPYMVDVNKKLKLLDIYASVDILQKFIQEKEKNSDAIEESVKTAIQYVHESLDNIRVELDSIDKKIKYHKTKWFKKYRTMDCSELLSNIELHNNILNKRLETLYNLLKVN